MLVELSWVVSAELHMPERLDIHQSLFRLIAAWRKWHEALDPVDVVAVRVEWVGHSLSAEVMGR